MKLISINIGEERELSEKIGKSGIYKFPITGSVIVGELGLDGDVIADEKNHGGVDQAIYVYGQTDYQWWEGELDRELTPGTFGENLTISDLESAILCVGDQLQVGEVLLQVTSPRTPCVKLATRMGDPQFIKRFTEAGRYGAYCRVLKTGSVKAGDAVSLTEYDGERVSMVDIIRASNSPTEAQLKQFLAVPISIGRREYYERKLAEMSV